MNPMSVSPVRFYKLPLAIASWLAFAISFTFYCITADPGVSYWDCPEYVTVASKLEIGHPPGNPIWMLVMRVATIPFPPELHAYVINICSGLFMAFATFFLSRLIFLFIILLKSNIPKTQGDIRATGLGIIVGIGGSLCFALCDSAWFSAVEAEVYAMSAFLSALTLWIMAVWWFEPSKSRRWRLLILLSYITGISIGVHQLNLLLIPVFALIILYKIKPQKINPLVVLGVLALAASIIAFILMLLFPAFLTGAGKFELFGVNGLGLPYNSGVYIFSVLIFIFIIIALILLFQWSPYLTRKISLIPYNSLWMMAFIILGFSSFGIIMVRSQASPPMNEGSPDNIFSLKSYVEREQYPSSPLLYGSTPYSRPIYKERFEAGKPNYSSYLLEKGDQIYQPVTPGFQLNHRSGFVSASDSLENKRVSESGHGYLLSDYRFNQVMTPELNMWFPRLTSRNINDREAYAGWAGMTEENMDRVEISETIDSLGNYLPRLNAGNVREAVYSYRPTYWQNFRYFLSYQAYYMYFRYLLWNFVGRQNDFHSQGEVEHGNFITGISLLDNLLPGETEYLPAELGKDNKGRNRYFAIPFILGLLGICFLIFDSRMSRRLLTVITILFVMTGIAIVVYLNQLPGEPRERDYTFLGSYMAFTIWIAAGVFGITKLVSKFINKKTGFIICVILSFGTPALMAVENFDDHDRRNRFEPAFYASSFLDFEIPAIIFSHGDNSSFPLWYASEVLDKGKKHTPVDITYMGLPSYIANLKRQGDKGLSTIASTPQFIYGKFILTKIPNDSAGRPMPVGEALRALYSSDEKIPAFPTSHISIPDNKGNDFVINLHDFSGGSSYLSFRHLMLLDMIASQLEAKEPMVLYFPYFTGYSFYSPLDSVLSDVLFGKIYAPGISDSIAADIMKKSLKREISKMEALNPSPHYMDPVIADRAKRYRGEMVVAAEYLLSQGDSVSAIEISDFIEKYYPYSKLSPGDFTMSDTTYYEGRQYRDLMAALYKKTGDKRFRIIHDNLDSIINRRHEEWMKYYRSLPADQRKNLSNRSKRLLIK